MLIAVLCSIAHNDIVVVVVVFASGAVDQSSKQFFLHSLWSSRGRLAPGQLKIWRTYLRSVEHPYFTVTLVSAFVSSTDIKLRPKSGLGLTVVDVVALPKPFSGQTSPWPFVMSPFVWRFARPHSHSRWCGVRATGPSVKCKHTVFTHSLLCFTVSAIVVIFETLASTFFTQTHTHTAYRGTRSLARSRFLSLAGWPVFL